MLIRMVKYNNTNNYIYNNNNNSNYSNNINHTSFYFHVVSKKVGCL